MPDSRGDAALLVASRNDPDAFACFYERHRERVLRYFAARTAAPEVAADLMAETFARALAGVRSYKPRREPAVAWLFAIARNQLTDARRRGQVQARARRRLALEPLVLDDEDIRIVERLASEEREAAQLLRGLPELEREAVRARVLEERDYRDIASGLRCSEAVVRKRVSRGLARLRNELEGAT